MERPGISRSRLKSMLFPSGVNRAKLSPCAATSSKLIACRVALGMDDVARREEEREGEYSSGQFAAVLP